VEFPQAKIFLERIRCYQDLIKQPSIFSDFLGFNQIIPFHPDHVSPCLGALCRKPLKEADGDVG
jgi:hypothetical protein